MELLSSGNRVETPFIIVEIDGVKLGAYDSTGKTMIKNGTVDIKDKSIYPNFVNSITVNKNANGMVNAYSIMLEYQITQFDDPNFIEKLFSRVKDGRRIRVSYGDLSNPEYAYREEECIISNIDRDISVSSNRITYGVSAVSASALAIGTTHNFSARKARPSQVLEEIIYNQSMGLLDVLTGMKDRDKVRAKGILSANDRVVKIDAKQNITAIDYIKLLVSYMQEDTGFIQNSIYMLSFEGDETNEMGGPYVKLVNSEETSNIDELSVDIGYPSGISVYDFKLTENTMYSILYNYSGVENQEGINTTTREIDNAGNIVNVYRNPLAIDTKAQSTTETARAWWTEMVKYPVKGVLTMRGLLRPMILTQAIRINSWFYGKKYNTSGRYRIISQVDKVSARGFTTELGVMRVEG